MENKPDLKNQKFSYLEDNYEKPCFGCKFALDSPSHLQTELECVLSNNSRRTQSPNRPFKGRYIRVDEQPRIPVQVEQEAQTIMTHVINNHEMNFIEFLANRRNISEE